MVKLAGISKSYVANDIKVQALKDVNLQFKQGEFVSILGPSGCGKTTMLNIIGGLDRYDSGDIEVNGKSTKYFKDKDWDAYRNHSIGFVFQSYNLIGHQTVLSNVELALTLAGVSKHERRKRAKAALEKVGLGKELKKKPNQLSGGQMQRVAIARALINDPEIILADEPTGALDSETSTQVMEILAEVAKEKLVIMVTHNGELAEQYSTRIIRLSDGVVISDSNPCNLAKFSTSPDKEEDKKALKNKSMSLKTAFTLSINNLFTKKGRTILTSFAGSIGIIGIALILSISSGFQGYIDRVQEETLSTNPITLQSATMSGGMAAMMFGGEGDKVNANREPDTVYSSTMLADMFNAIQTDVHINDLESFKEYIESDECEIKNVSTVSYDYGLTLSFYSSDTSNGVVKADTVEIIDIIYESFVGITYSDFMNSLSSGLMGGSLSGFSSLMNMDMWCELINNQPLLDSQYEVLKGNWPKAYNEVVLCISENYNINEFVEFGMNLRSREELYDLLEQAQSSEGVEYDKNSYKFEDLLNTTFKLVLNSDLYEEQSDGTWKDMSDDAEAMKELVDNGIEIKIVGIIRPRDDSIAQSMSGVLGYTDDLVTEIINRTNESGVVLAQKASPETNVLTGKPFSKGGTPEATLPPELEAFVKGLGAELEAEFYTLMGNEDTAVWMNFMKKLPDEKKQDFVTLMQGMSQNSGDVSESTYEENLEMFGSVDLNMPTSIIICPTDFAAKDTIKAEVEKYNKKMLAETGNNEKEIQYTDILEQLLSSVSTIIEVISYVLIAFVAISLVVSSIMIGVITYISVLERTKEIGILRAMGASKHDITRVFNAETFVVGLIAGLMGVGTTVLLNIPVNMIINSFANLGNISALPVNAGFILVCISVFLTIIAGLIPSRMASKKDPVVALRTE